MWIKRSEWRNQFLNDAKQSILIDNLKDEIDNLKYEINRLKNKNNYISEFNDSSLRIDTWKCRHDIPGSGEIFLNKGWEGDKK